MKFPRRTPTSRVVLPYVLVALIYSLISHYALGVYYGDLGHYWIEVTDDVLLVALTGFLIFLLLRQEVREWHKVDDLRRAANEELEKVLAQIRSERALFQNLIKNVPAAIALFSGLDLRLRWGNPAAPALFGRAPESDISGQAAADLFASPPWPQMAGLFRRVTETREAYEDPEWMSVSTGGDHAYWRLRVMPLMREDGACCDLMVLATEVTQEVRARHQIEQLARESAEQARTLSAVLDVSRELTSTLDVAPLLQLILDQLGMIVDYGAATLFAVEGDEVVALSSRNRAGQMATEPHRILLGESPLIAQVVADRAPVIIASADDDRSALVTAVGALPAGNLSALPVDCPCSWIGVPLIIKDNLIGVLELSDDACGSFTIRDAQVVLAIASQAAVAIENARLYGHAQRAAALEERQRLSRELHDSVSQALYAVSLNAQSALEMAADSPAPLQRVLKDIWNLGGLASAEMRALIFELRTDLLERQGLQVSLAGQAASVQARHGIPVDCELGDEPDLTLPAKEALYRIAQQALQNAAQHAAPSRIALRVKQDGADTVLEVQDDGVGFDSEASFPGHLGLQSMRERANGVGGQFAVHTGRGQGTLVMVRIPGLG